MAASSVIVEVEDLKPKKTSFNLATTALIIIDMQVDFLQKGGFGCSLGNDLSKVQRAIGPCQTMLEAAREANLLIIHTREGHRPDMSDIHSHKVKQTKNIIGHPGPNGRILIRGEPGHDIIKELYPKTGEPIVDKPGKGSFYATDLELLLASRDIKTLLVCGVTTEVCVHTTVREANDRGFQCIVVEDACASYLDEFHESAIKMVWAQGGLFGSVGNSTSLSKAILQK